jgi:hypothetical protein
VEIARAGARISMAKAPASKRKEDNGRKREKRKGKKE